MHTFPRAPEYLGFVLDFGCVSAVLCLQKRQETRPWYPPIAQVCTMPLVEAGFGDNVFAKSRSACRVSTLSLARSTRVVQNLPITSA